MEIATISTLSRSKSLFLSSIKNSAAISLQSLKINQQLSYHLFFSFRGIKTKHLGQESQWYYISERLIEQVGTSFPRNLEEVMELMKAYTMVDNCLYLCSVW